MEFIRLDKFLSDMGVGTRSEVKKKIKKGCVFVNGDMAKNPDQKVQVAEDVINVDGCLVEYRTYEYYMLYKPVGVVSATKDKFDKTVLDCIPSNRKDLFPVGRLDKDTEGLLLITNDGILAHQLLSPKKQVNKVYFAKVSGDISDKTIQMFQEGIWILEGVKSLPAKLEILEQGEICSVLVTICEGKFHQVKKMFEKTGGKVLYLKRLSMGSLCLDESLQIGEYRSLSKEEIESLKREVGSPQAES